MLAAGLVIAPAVAASFPPGEGGAAGTVTASFSPSTVCNTGSAQSLTLSVAWATPAADGALKTLFVAVPTGYGVVPGSVTAPPGTPSVVSVGSTKYIRVGSLKLNMTAPQVTVTFNATLPSSATSTPATWAIEGETGNDSKPDLDKPDGDDYYAPTLPTTTVAENCTLAFAPGPADAGANLNITSVALTPSGASVAVDVTDTNSVVLTPAPVITLMLTGTADSTNSSPMLNGGAPVTATATSAIPGVATFATLNVNDPGSYTLAATASMAGISSATSGSFRIWGAAATCATGCTLAPLTGSTPPGGSPETFNVASTSTTGAIGASLDIVSIDCSAADFGGVAALPGTDTITWTSSGTLTAGKTTTIFIPDTTLMQGGLLAEIHYMVCASVQDYDFPVAYTPLAPTLAAPDTVVEGVLGGTWYRGLLPDCQDVANARPCVASRVHGMVGGVSGVTVTVLTGVGMGDPFGR
jgi:hypothetical protein